MSIYEYDEEKHMRQTREEGFNDGLLRTITDRSYREQLYMEVKLS